MWVHEDRVQVLAGLSCIGTLVLGQFQYVDVRNPTLVFIGNYSCVLRYICILCISASARKLEYTFGRNVLVVFRKQFGIEPLGRCFWQLVSKKKKKSRRRNLRCRKSHVHPLKTEFFWKKSKTKFFFYSRWEQRVSHDLFAPELRLFFVHFLTPHTNLICILPPSSVIIRKWNEWQRIYYDSFGRPVLQATRLTIDTHISIGTFCSGPLLNFCLLPITSFLYFLSFILIGFPLLHLFFVLSLTFFLQLF